MTLALTGSTGQLGGRVAAQLSDLAPILLVRDASRAPDIAGSEVRLRTVWPRRLRAALEGVDTLFMVSAAEAFDRRDQHRAFIDAAARAGVGHIVYTSFSGASADADFTLGRDHADAEQAIKASGMAYTLLRDNFYADLLPYFADEQGVIRGPAGDGRVAAVARADVADVATVVLRDPTTHAGATYELTGPEALTHGGDRRPSRQGAGSRAELPRRDGRRGVRLALVVRRRAVAAGRVGEHLHRDPERSRSRGSPTTWNA